MTGVSYHGPAELLPADDKVPVKAERRDELPSTIRCSDRGFAVLDRCDLHVKTQQGVHQSVECL